LGDFLTKFGDFFTKSLVPMTNEQWLTGLENQGDQIEKISATCLLAIVSFEWGLHEIGF
jgi:hypothetical protein